MSQSVAPVPVPEAAAAAPAATPQQLMEGCQGLVRTIAWKVHRKLPPRVELDDLIAYGQVGLAQAARDFDPDRGGQFTTYAYYRVRGAILDGLSQMSWFSRHDYHAGRYERMANDYLSQQDSGPASAEEDVRWLDRVSGGLVVVQLASGETDTGQNAAAQVEDEATPAPAARLLHEELCQKLRSLIDALPPDAAALIRGAYFEGLTLQEAGRRIGVSKAWASRLHARALDRLAQSLRLAGAAD